MRRLIATAAVAGMTLAITLISGPASAAPDTAAADGSPCTAPFTHPTQDRKVQNCPDWSPVGAIPVYTSFSASSPTVGAIDPSGDDWYICQDKGESFSLPGGITNNWWAATMADNGEFGWVNQVYFRGGGNNKPDAGLRHC